MGTNYYLHVNTCDHCKRPEKVLHIGKSSAGWCFGLHVEEEEGPKSLADWEALMNDPKNEIFNEYNDLVSIKEMLSTITDRAWENVSDSYPGYANEQDFYRQNYAAPGPNGLIRHAVDGYHCVANGEGTYDLVRGEFS